MERIADRYIRDEPLKNRPLHVKQHAYVAGKLVESAIHSTVGTIKKALNATEFALGGFLDMEGAFNKLTFAAENKSTTHFGDTTVRNWINTMLESRRVIAQYGNSNKIVTRGCPQGGVLSPILWDMVIDNLRVRELHSKGFNT